MGLRASEAHTPRGGSPVIVSKFIYEITGAGELAQLPRDNKIGLPTTSALTQDEIDGHLSTTSEFSAAQFDATSMSDDAVGVLFDLGGQCQSLVAVKACVYSGVAGVTKVEQFVEASSSLTDSTLVTEAAKGAQGNVGVKLALGNTPDYDSLTDGYVEIELQWRAK